MPRGKILVVEDESDLVQMIRYNLQKEGYRILRAGDAERGLALARREKPDLILLDIMLPGMDGLEFCRVMRQTSRVPIIFLTAKKSETDRILGLRLGGDDYITKPFSIGELVARIEAVLRRTANLDMTGDGKGTARAGGIEVDFERHEVRVNGKTAELTPKEFQFLKILISADGKVLTRNHLLEHVWGFKDPAEIDTRTVDQHIARLRRKLGSESARIVTITGVGYRIQGA